MSDLLMRDIYKNFGETKVIHGINIEISDGEFIVILGPSGCGKSTLLRMIAGLETVTSGEIFINNIKVNDVEPMDRNIAMVFQNYALYPHMTVEENMSFGLRMNNAPKNKINKKLKEDLDEQQRHLIDLKDASQDLHTRLCEREDEINSLSLKLFQCEQDNMELRNLYDVNHNRIERVSIELDNHSH